MEKWHPVLGFEGLYEVSNFGNVRSVARRVRSGNSDGYRISPGIVLSHRANKNRDGYIEICLVDHYGKRYNKKVHRLVAEAFLPNPQNLPQVNHKDHDVANNNVANLEWCDAKYNALYSMHRRQNMRGKFGNAVAVYDLDGNELGRYGSIRDAARHFNVHGQNICANLSGKQKHVKKMIFKRI